MSIALSSPAFTANQPIPVQHTGDGPDVCPALSWKGVPDGTRSLAIIMDDPDAPTPQPWVHWVIWNIPGDAPGLPEGMPRKDKLDNPKGALQGKNSWPSGNIGYRGPAPPPGKPHRYYFKLYALDTLLTLPAGADKSQLLKAMQGHTLAQGELMGTYQRK